MICKCRNVKKWGKFSNQGLSLPLRIYEIAIGAYIIARWTARNVNVYNMMSFVYADEKSLSQWYSNAICPYRWYWVYLYVGGSQVITADPAPCAMVLSDLCTLLAPIQTTTRAWLHPRYKLSNWDRSCVKAIQDPVPSAPSPATQQHASDRGTIHGHHFIYAANNCRRLDL